MKKSQRWHLLAICFLITSALGILISQIPRWVAYLSAFCMIVSLIYQDKVQESEAEIKEIEE